MDKNLVFLRESIKNHIEVDFVFEILCLLKTETVDRNLFSDWLCFFRATKQAIETRFYRGNVKWCVQLNAVDAGRLDKLIEIVLLLSFRLRPWC